MTIYIYIHIESEREKERGRSMSKPGFLLVSRYFILGRDLYGLGVKPMEVAGSREALAAGP